MIFKKELDDLFNDVNIGQSKDDDKEEDDEINEELEQARVKQKFDINEKKEIALKLNMMI